MAAEVDKADQRKGRPGASSRPGRAVRDSPLRDAWADYIAELGPHHLMATFTFRVPPHPEHADKSFRRWVREVNQRLYGKRYLEQGKGLHWVRGLERTKADVIHFHSLLGGDGLAEVNRFSLQALWERDNGWAKIEPYDGRIEARRYLFKMRRYAAKGGELDVYLPWWKKAAFLRSRGEQFSLNVQGTA
jgi:hypothetical protein